MNTSTETAAPKPPATGQGIRLELTREFSHSRERLFTALTTPAAILRWFGPPGVTNLDAQVDLRVGGRYRFTVKGMNDGPIFYVAGQYLEIIPPELLRFTWQWEHCDAAEPEMTVSFHLASTPTGCRLTLVQTGFSSQEDCDRHTHGWTGSLDRLSQFGD